MASAAGEPRVIRILAFGDSLTEGWYRNGTRFHPYTSRLLELLSPIENTTFEVNNHGVSGETTRAMTPRLARVLAQHDPYDLTIILGGTNDMGMFSETGDPLFQRIKCLHENVLHHNARTKTVVVTVPETGYEIFSGYAKLKEKRLHVNESLRLFALECKERVILSDLSKRLPRASLSTEDLDKFWDDGLHFTAEGYNKMADIIFEDIKHLFPMKF